MKVYFTTFEENTVESKVELIKKLITYLNNVQGPVKFIYTGFISKWELIKLDEKYKKFYKTNYQLTLNDFYDIADLYRTTYRVRYEDIVVFLGPSFGPPDFYPGYRGRNIFFPRIYPFIFGNRALNEFIILTSSLLSLIFKCLINFNNDPLKHNEYHKQNNCLFDINEDERQVFFRIQLDHICSACLYRYRSFNYPEEFINYVQDMKEFMKNESGFINEKKTPKYHLHLSEQGNISINSMNVKMEAIHKTLYIFLLLNKEGLQQSQLENYIEDLFYIYKFIKPSAEKDKIIKLVLPYSHPNSTFSVVKSTINSVLNKQLGEKVAGLFAIDKSPENYLIYKINQGHNSWQIDFKLDK